MSLVRVQEERLPEDDEETNQLIEAIAQRIATCLQAGKQIDFLFISIPLISFG